MATLKSCLIWQIICVILPPNEYGCAYTWTTLRSGSAIDLQKMPISAKKKSSFWSWHICKQTKLSHLEHRKPARIHWKFDAPKTSHCLVRILVQSHDGAIFLRQWRRSCSQKLKRRILAKFGFNRKLHSIFYALFLKITLSASQLMSFGHLGAAIWHRWSIICGVISVTPTSQWLPLQFSENLSKNDMLIFLYDWVQDNSYPGRVRNLQVTS